MSEVPAIWPTPGNPDTRVRVFRVEIERPETSAPTIAGHMQEAFEVGPTAFRNHRPDLMLTSDLVTLATDEDAELSAAVIRCGNDLNLIMWKLYERLPK